MRIGRAHGRLVIIDGDGSVENAASAAASSAPTRTRCSRCGTGSPNRQAGVRRPRRPHRPAGARGTRRAGADPGPGVRDRPELPGRRPVRRRRTRRPAGVHQVPQLPRRPTFAAVELPSDRVDWEVELVAVIGRPAERVPEEKAWSYVAGLMVGQDLSERTVQLARPGAAGLAGQVVSRLRADRAVAGHTR